MATAKKSAAKKSAAEKSTTKGAGTHSDEQARVDAVLGAGPELVGPPAEHEDHEGGITDSLARRGVRAPLPDAEEKEELAEKERDEADEGVIRAASIRERQTRVPVHMATTPRAVRELAAARRVDEGTPVKVVAESAGFYPGGAGGKRRRPGDVFIYTMSPEEEVLPSWLLAVDGSVGTRRPGEDVTGERIQIETTTTTTTRGGAASGNAGMFGHRAAAAAAPARTGVPAPAAKSTSKSASKSTRNVL